jgi:beta-galactosidase/beta-glucuronidase
MILRRRVTLVQNEIEILTGDVTDMEARVVARFHHRSEPTTLRGTVRGPFCGNSRTLPAEFPFRERKTNAAAKETIEAEAFIPDPCLWSPDLPHLYQVDVEALCEDRVVADYHGTIGLRRLAPRRPVDFAPGTG